jgi:proteasome assembly chaperone (PAC2) family protein
LILCQYKNISNTLSYFDPIESMTQDIITLKKIPKSTDALFIAGFDGWGNALNISRGLVDFIIQKMDVKPFAKLNPDSFYKFDVNRPMVVIEDGILKRLEPSGGYFYYIEKKLVGRNLIILSAMEPSLHWFQFSDVILSLCHTIGVQTIISLGSMYDNVLHTETVFSGIASSAKLLSEISEKRVLSISYEGPTAVHSILHSEAIQKGLQSVCIWCHCPYYLQGTTHFGLLSHLGSLLASWGGFQIDTKELDIAWKDLSKQIFEIVDKNPELQQTINEMRKTKMKGSWDMSNKRNDKIIRFEDFLNQDQD